jgi:hypothetical protein
LSVSSVASAECVNTEMFWIATLWLPNDWTTGSGGEGGGCLWSVHVLSTGSGGKLSFFI